MTIMPLTACIDHTLAIIRRKQTKLLYRKKKKNACYFSVFLIHSRFSQMQSDKILLLADSRLASLPIFTKDK